MGIFRDPKSGNFGIRVWYFGREFKKIIGKDKRSAQLALDEIRSEIRLAKLVNQQWNGFSKLQKSQRPRTFAEAAADYMAERANYKASSLVSYKSILDTHLLPEFGNTPLRSLTDTSIKRFQVRLSENVSASRVNTIMQLFRSIVDQEYRQGDLDRDPSRSVRRLPEPKVKIDPLSLEELENVLKHIDAHYRPLFTALAFTGARPNELIALRWKDIDWARDSINITKGRVRGAEGVPKTRAGERAVPMTPRVRDVLLLLRDGTLFSKDGYVFTNKKGQPINKHLDVIWKRALKKAGLRHRPSYQLRHTFVTQCIIKGFPLPFIAKIIGHSTIDTLIRHYAGWIDSATKEQEEKLRKAFDVDTPKTNESDDETGSKTGRSAG